MSRDVHAEVVSAARMPDGEMLVVVSIDAAHQALISPGDTVTLNIKEP